MENHWPKPEKRNIVSLREFSAATRDSGYKNLAYALAELIDNSFQAESKSVSISHDTAGSVFRITIADDGEGMTANQLAKALQFGGSSRFGTRHGAGRFGLGLPNSSFSQARRVDIYSWRKRSRIFHTYLDLDELASGTLVNLPKPVLISKSVESDSGTIVVWSKIDRLPHDRVPFDSFLVKTLGQLFRRALSAGRSINIDGKDICPVDPLFLNVTSPLPRAKRYGAPLTYNVRVPQDLARSSQIYVQFSELPVGQSTKLSNPDKAKFGITKKAGVSVLRAGREIDYGWFFMGTKRKENYDDWWRCEIGFEPDLDELFGVTNTKQGISPRRDLVDLLAPDIEQIARTLNSRVRNAFASLSTRRSTLGTRAAEKRDTCLEPPAGSTMDDSPVTISEGPSDAVLSKKRLRGLKYEYEAAKELNGAFFSPILKRGTLIVRFDENHPFFRDLFKVDRSDHATRQLRRALELIVLSAARAEVDLSVTEQLTSMHLREKWGKVLAAFLD